MSCLDDYRMTLKGREFLPLMVGGMGTNISTSALVLAIEKLGGIAHLSDAMLPTVADKELGTDFTKQKTILLEKFIGSFDKSLEKFDLAALAEVSDRYFRNVMDKVSGKGLVLVNCMEKLTMNDQLGTLKTRLNSALNAGVDGITMSAGLHLNSLKLMQDNPRFKDALLGLVVSSTRALNLFLKRTSSIGRKLDYIVVEGPLAGGHLGFGEDWRNYKLENIVKDVVQHVKECGLNIPVLGAGGVFSGQDDINLIEQCGAAGAQVATRFTIAQESGLPQQVKEIYLDSKEEDVVVNHLSPTGYLMRMLKSSPAITAKIHPNCESYGYMLSGGSCPYLKEFEAQEQGAIRGENSKCCLCTQMRNYKVWTCGTTVSKLKETVKRSASGWELPSAEQIWNDYRFGKNSK